MNRNLKFYVGIDVSKPYFDASMMEVSISGKKVLEAQRFSNDKAGLLHFQKYYKSSGVTDVSQLFIVIENTGVYHRRLWQFCGEQNIALHIGNAAHIKWSLGITRGKSDKIDSNRLCQYAYKNRDELQATAALNPVILQLKDLMAARVKLLGQYNSTKAYLQELKLSNDALTQKFLDQAHKSALQGIQKSLEKVEALIKKIIQSDAALQRNYALIVSIPGVGHITAVYVLCCTNNFAGKISGKQLASYAGVVPFEHSSGISVKGRNRVHKMANKDLKKLLHMCALSSIKYSEEMKAYYNRKTAEGKNGMSVLNAIRNKLVLRIASVVNNQQPYVCNYAKAC